jgi:hypothetical protein
MCCHPYGTRVIQKILEKANKKNINNFITLVVLNCIELANNVNGNHVILKILQSRQEYSDHVLSRICTNFMIISTNKQGCATMQKCHEYANITQKNILNKLVIENSSILMSDKYGHYVIKYIFSVMDPFLQYKLISSIISNIGYLAKQKYASNVIESVNILYINI